MGQRSRVTSTSRPTSAQSHANLRLKRWEKKRLYNAASLQKRATGPDTAVAGQPPPGYTFLTVGYPDLSTKCKELSREKGVEIRVVSASTKFENATSKISSHLHRIGYHIRTDIFDESCTWLGYRFVNGKLVKNTATNPTSGFERTFAKFGADISQLGSRSATQEESVKVKNAIRELFPKIPEQSLNEIFETAWQKGATTVGNELDLPLARRVQLATVAHIRHTYTDYDRILQSSNWGDARRAVEPYCLAKLVEWRGEDETNDDAIDGILQQAIVLSENESPVEHSEPDRYADNEDSSDGNYEITHRVANPADLERTPSAFEGSPTAGLPFQTSRPQVSRPASSDGKYRDLLQARWRHARLRARQAEHHVPVATTAFAPQGSALVESLTQINVPVDHRGRAPRRFIQDGIEYVRATPEELAMHNIAASPQPHQEHVRYAHPVYPQITQPPHAPPQHYPGLAGQYQHHLAAERPIAYEIISPPIQDLPPQRFFDTDGNEVFLDPASHQLTPAFSAPHNRIQTASNVLATSHPHGPSHYIPQHSRLSSASARVNSRPASVHGYAQTIHGGDDSETEDDVYVPPPITNVATSRAPHRIVAPGYTTMSEKFRVKTITPEVNNAWLPSDAPSSQRIGNKQPQYESQQSSSSSDDGDDFVPNNLQAGSHTQYLSHRNSTARSPPRVSNYLQEPTNYCVPSSTGHQSRAAHTGNQYVAFPPQPGQYVGQGVPLLDHRFAPGPIALHGAPASAQPVQSRPHHRYADSHPLRDHAWDSAGSPVQIYPAQHYDPYTPTSVIHPPLPR